MLSLCCKVNLSEKLREPLIITKLTENRGVVMQRIKLLDRYQKAVLIIITVMILVFTVVYPITIARVGFLYNNVIFTPSQQNGNTIYSAKIDGKQASFIVSEDKKVEFQYGDKIYGPYIAKEDSTAIPKNNDMSEFMTGIEIKLGEEIIFRGAILNLGDYRQLYNENGDLENIGISLTTNYETVVNEDINQIDPITIVDLITEPELTHKGEWTAWIYGVLICVVTVISILFADELFRLDISFKIRGVERAEPSDWEIACRYISWTVFPLIAMILFIIGLQ